MSPGRVRADHRPSLSPVACLLNRIAACGTRLSDGFRRLRRRYAELHQLPSVDVTADGKGVVHWVRDVRLGSRSYDALVCSPNSKVAFDVVLPANATIVASVAVGPSGSLPRCGVVFEIQVRAQDIESVARVRVVPNERRQRWRRLRVRGPREGPARITLTMTAHADDLSASAMWGAPRIEWPRTTAQAVSGLRAAVANWGIRGAWHRVTSTPDQLYSLWVRETADDRSKWQLQRDWSRAQLDTFSLITCVSAFDWPVSRTAKSLVAQSYPHWEWILVGTQTSLDEGRTTLERLIQDSRVRVQRVPDGATRADAWNGAIREARGRFVALLGTKDTLSPSALYEMARLLERAPDCDVAYSDEDRLPRSGSRRHGPQFKPDWSPDLLLAGNYVGRMTVLRRERVLAVGGFRGLYEGAEEWDLLLRLSRGAPRIQRVPRCLYHRNETRTETSSPGDTAALEDHCRELGITASVSRAGDGYRVVWPLPNSPLVSIIIPNRNAAAVIAPCVSGVLDATQYSHRELIVVDNSSTDSEVLSLYRSIEERGGRIIPFRQPFNFSAACNAGAGAASGDLLLFLNNDVEVIEPDWLEELVRWALRPEVGIVGAKLLYPDRTIQHAGVVFGIGLVGHIFSRGDEGTVGLFGSPNRYRNYLGVTGACHMMRRDVFRQLGGYNQRYQLSFSDIVLCMEAWRAGYRVVYTPHARLVHHESYTRKREDWSGDLRLLVQYLDDSGFVEDPYFHPELDPTSTIPAVRPPFGPSPSQAVREYMDRVLATTEVQAR